MSDWRIRHKDTDGPDAQSTLLCREAAIVQALFLDVIFQEVVHSV